VEAFESWIRQYKEILRNGEIRDGEYEFLGHDDGSG